ILAHYQAGTNANYGTNYETLVFTAAFTGPERIGLPKTYLRFNDPAAFRAANSGTLGPAANGNLVLTSNSVPGPQSPTYPGSGANYAVGSASYDDGTTTTTTQEATFAVPSGDLGSTAWIHLVGTYDGANWRLYRNGALVATQASGTGALPVDLGDLAIGATG